MNAVLLIVCADGGLWFSVGKPMKARSNRMTQARPAKGLNITISAGTGRSNRHQLVNNLHESTNAIFDHSFHCNESFQFEEVGDGYRDFDSRDHVVDGRDDQRTDGARLQVE
jgi:hypothetical protein